MKHLLVVIAVAITLLAGCNGGEPPTSAPSSPTMPGTEVTVPNGSYWRVTPAQLYGMGPSGLSLVCVDTEPAIVISNNGLFVKYNEITQYLDRFPADKNQ